MMQWWSNQSDAVKIAVVAGAAVCLLGAMWFGYNLGWVPDVMRGWFGVGG